MSDNNDKNFVNFHVLISHSPSNLNRDDMGMQKIAIFGGVKRTRISSQSLKRAIRKSKYYEQHLGQPSIRTRELGQFIEKMKESLRGRYDNEIIQCAIEYLYSQDNKKKKENKESEEKKEGPKQSGSVVAWVRAEIEFICEQIQNMQPTKEDLSKKERKRDNKNKLDGKLKKILEEHKVQLNQAISNATDIALSGRMTTSGMMKPVDGALAVAHAITTNAVNSEIDWFTAVDDLKQEEDSEDKGSAHLDTTEFSSGVFYRYASLNLKQLQKNLGDENNRSKALEIASHVLHLLTTVTPSAKQNSFAAHNLADFALVSLSHQPLSFANAFEVPVKHKYGLLKPSVYKLLKYQQEIKDAYSLKEDPTAFYFVRSFSKYEDNKDKLDNYIETLTNSKTLEGLKQWLCNHAN